MIRLLLSLAILLWATAASGQLWSGILAATRATDWTSPGVTGGIPTNRTKSGSTIAACAALGIRSIGLEIDQEYFQMARVAIPKLAGLKVPIQVPNGSSR